MNNAKFANIHNINGTPFTAPPDFKALYEQAGQEVQRLEELVGATADELYAAQEEVEVLKEREAASQFFYHNQLIAQQRSGELERENARLKRRMNAVKKGVAQTVRAF